MLTSQSPKTDNKRRLWEEIQRLENIDLLLLGPSAKPRAHRSKWLILKYWWLISFFHTFVVKLRETDMCVIIYHQCTYTSITKTCELFFRAMAVSKPFGQN